jgi:hypothetical protein
MIGSFASILILISVGILFIFAPDAFRMLKIITDTKLADKKRAVTVFYDYFRVFMGLIGLLSALYGLCSLCLIKFRNNCLCICWQGMCLTLLMMVTFIVAVPILLFTVYPDTAVEAVCTNDFHRFPIASHIQQRFKWQSAA